jgi:hypothetical protein
VAGAWYAADTLHAARVHGARCSRSRAPVSCACVRTCCTLRACTRCVRLVGAGTGCMPTSTGGAGLRRGRVGQHTH